MGVYVEITCDVNRKGHDPGNVLDALCWMDRGDSPQGRTIAAAAKEARRIGWTVKRGGYAVCPGCRAAFQKANPDE